MQVLRKGGSATDAAIAVMLALGVVEPQSSGIGGGGFYVRTDSQGTVETLDGRETAPAAAGADWFLDADGKPLDFRDVIATGKSIGVPGNIALAAEAHQRHGVLAWSELFQPALALARDGWVLTERGADYAARFADRAGLDPYGNSLFYDSSGAPRPVGTRITNPALAATLERLALEGPDTFYQGPHARAMADTIAAATPGAARMTTADIAGYQAIWRDPVCGSYRIYRICGMGPPSSGATTVFAILKQLEGFDLGALGPQSPVFWHIFAESQRVAYADRARYLADSDFVPVPVSGLIDAEYLRGRGALIAPDRRMPAVDAGRPSGAIAVGVGHEPAESGTSHFVVIDAADNAVSYTSTIENSFGSGHMVGGFFLNNELTDFSFVPEAEGQPVANRVEGGKRPRSSMSPTLVFAPDGSLKIAIGAAGGATIPVQVAETLIAILDWNMDADAAIALPLLFSPGDTMFIEGHLPLQGLVPQLEALGHKVRTAELPHKVNAIVATSDGWLPAADPRSEGAGMRD